MAEPSPPTASPSFALPHLPLPVRLVLGAFLCSVGIGYLSALVNLHFQEASPGELLPTKDDVVSSYAGPHKISQLQRLLETRDTAPFNGQGSMRSAFTFRVAGMKKALQNKVAELVEKDPNRELDLKKQKDNDFVTEEVRKDLDGERRAMILWAQNPPQKNAYENNAFELPTQYKDLQITRQFVEDVAKDVAGQKKSATVRVVKIKSIFEKRCLRCHDNNVGGAGSEYPLTSWEELSVYVTPEGPTGKSLMKLALTTHVHLLGFSMLYGMTGLIFAFSTYPVWLRVLIAPTALLAQVVDISFWWLARMPQPHGSTFAELIQISGGVVGLALALQIILSLFNLFKATGKLVLVLLFAVALVGGYFAKTKIVDPYLTLEKTHPISTEKGSGG